MTDCPFCGAVETKPSIFQCATFLHDSPKGDHRGYDCLLTQLAQQSEIIQEALKIVERYRPSYNRHGSLFSCLECGANHGGEHTGSCTAAIAKALIPKMKQIVEKK
jgi:hypothetical protein